MQYMVVTPSKVLARAVAWDDPSFKVGQEPPLKPTHASTPKVSPTRSAYSPQRSNHSSPSVGCSCYPARLLLSSTPVLRGKPLREPLGWLSLRDQVP